MWEVLQAMRQERLWLLILCISFWMASIGIMIPHITPVAASYFASRSTGSLIDCSAFQHDDLPEACKAANSTTISWVSWASFFSNAVFGLTLVPLGGWLSDQYGRKPFLIASQALYAGPLAWAALYIHSPLTTPFSVYYVLEALKGAVQPFSVILAHSADLTPPSARASLFSLILACISLASMASAGIGAALGPGAASVTSLALYAANAALLTVFLPESLSAEKRAAAQREARKEGPDGGGGGALNAAARGLRTTFAVLVRSRLFAKLAAIMAVSGMVFECMRDVLLNYLMLTLGFGARENAAIMVTIGLGSLLVQALVLPALLRATTEKWVLVIALAASVFEMALLAAAPHTGAATVFVGLGIGALGSMAFPVISAVKSSHAAESEQGKVQGALFGARCLAQGVGPLLFSAAFRYYTHEPHYMPSITLVFAAVVMAAGVVVALMLHIPPVGARSGQLRSGAYASVGGHARRGGGDGDDDPDMLEMRSSLLHSMDEERSSHGKDGSGRESVQLLPRRSVSLARRSTSREVERPASPVEKRVARSNDAAEKLKAARDMTTLARLDA